MPGKERRRRVRGESMALDTLHIVIGAAVVVMAVISFINPEEYMVFLSGHFSSGGYIKSGHRKIQI